jgi:cytoskeleton protein RodZ
MADTGVRGDKSQAPAAKLGAELRAARRALGWEIPQLADSLRIRQPYLEAIEAGRVADLPGTTYALGFVRAYASALGMDAEAVSRRFREEATDVNGTPALRFPAPVPRRGVPAGALILLGLVVLTGAYALWYQVTEHRLAPVETVPPIPERLTPAAPRPAPSPQVASMLPGATAPTPPPVPGAAQNAPAASGPPERIAPPVESPGYAATVVPDHAAGASQLQTLRESHDAPQQDDAAPAQGAAPPADASKPPALAAGRIVVKTTGDAWITIKQKTGPNLLNKMMHAGDSFVVPADTPGLTLTTGFAGATVIEVDGQPIAGGLGAGGMVRRDIPLDADTLKSGKLPPAAPRRAPPAP